MYFISAISALPLWIFLFASSVRALWLLENLSFGHKLPLTQPGSGGIPGWTASGEGFVPQILSDRIILTPMAQGTKRGALWATETLNSQEWEAELEFRASGPDRGGGNFQVWLTQKSLGTSSLYTAGAFDGLVIMLDQYGGRGGTIRAFLNDGTTDYKTHHNIDRLPFGKCDYPYRNRGMPSKITLVQGRGFFEVKVDEKLCFRSDKTALPQGYYFGITAASADIGDSFEINKFVVSGSNNPAAASTSRTEQQQQQPTSHNLPPIDPNANLQQSFGRAGGGPLDSQGADLMLKLTPVTEKVEAIYKVIFELDKKLDERLNQLGDKVAASNSPSTSSSAGASVDQFKALENRIKSIEQSVHQILEDLEGKDFEEHLDSVHRTVQRSQQMVIASLSGQVSQLVTSAAPRMGFFIFIILGSQALLVVAYVVYKRRRNSMPKKFL